MRRGWWVFCGVLLVQACWLPASSAGAGTLSEEPRAMLTEAEVHKLKVENGTAAYAAAPKKPHQAPTGGSHSRLSEKPIPIPPLSKLPDRNPPVIEWNEPFLGAGNIKRGFKIPTGATWQPAFWVFGDFYTNAGYADNGVDPARSWVSSRFDVFGHLQLTPTERVVIGFSPLSSGMNRGTGLLHVNGHGTEFVNGFDPNIKTLFFEGDTRQLFPNIDPDDRLNLDFGFAIGKQPIFFQEGIMIDDNIQALGITKDTMQIPGTTQDMRVTGLFGWADIRRGDNLHDPTAYLFGLFTETDFRRNIVTVDFAYVASDNPRDPRTGLGRGGDGFYFGASTTQRFGELNTAFRINTSSALEGRGTAVDNGVLLLAEFSRNAPASNNIIYANFFQTFGTYTSAARGAQQGGPLARVGILFVPTAAGLAGPPMVDQASHVFGAALGYQMFFDANRTQLTLELAGRDDTNGSHQGMVGFGAQYIKAITSRTSVQVNGFVTAGEDRRVGSGLIVETRTRL